MSSDASSADKVSGAKFNVPSATTSPIKYPSGATILIYVFCVTSLGFSVYTSMCHSQLETRIRNFQRLDERISVLEAKLRIFPIQFLQSLATLPSASSSTTADNGTASVDALTPEAASAVTSSSTLNDHDDDDDGAIAGDSLASADEFANIVRKLSVQISGIQRLRRDVTYLKATRRGERQASVQQTSECMCPPGK